MPISSITNGLSSATARSRINEAIDAVNGLGDASTKNVGTTAGTVAAGDDARLSDSRAPTSHTHAVADLPIASQAEAEAGTATTKVMTPQTTAQAIAALASSGGASTPRVIHVQSNGNDTTGDGSMSTPYASAQKAFDVAYAGTGPYVISLGAKDGDFGNVLCPGGWPSRIGLQGVSAESSKIFIVSSTQADGTGASAESITIIGDKCFITLINASGAGGAQGEQGTTPPQGDPEFPSSVNGNDGGPGGNGGDGGAITAIGITIVGTESVGGAGGPGGAGGAGDMGGMQGNPGTDGIGGNSGTVTLRNCNVTNVTCAALKSTFCYYEDSPTLVVDAIYGGNNCFYTLPSLTGDWGGNSVRN